MDQGEKKQIKPVAAVIVIFEIIFVVFVVLTIRNLMQKNVEVPNISIDNYSAIPELSVVGGDNSGVAFELDETKKSVVESVLYDEILFNSVGNIYNGGAKIRVGSAYNVYISELDVYMLNFIVDIEGLGQSYRVVYRWTDKYPNENIPQNVPGLAFCLDEDELIYGDFGCKDKYDGYGADTVAYGLLQNKTFGNAVLSLSGDVYNGEPLMINVYVDSNDDSVVATAIEEISSYLASTGFDLEDFDYEVSVNFVY